MTELSIKAVQDRYMNRKLMMLLEGNDLAALFRADVGYLLSKLSKEHPANAQAYKTMKELHKAMEPVDRYKQSETSVTYTIDKDNLPKGPHWDRDGACYEAELCDIDPKDNGWRWAARNPMALAKGYMGQQLWPFVLPTKHSTQNSLLCSEHGLTPDPECMVCHLNPIKKQL